MPGNIKDQSIRQLVEGEMARGFLWPEPLIHLNPAFEPGESIQQLIAQGEFHPACLEALSRQARG
jgi:hypothetical protein